MKLSPNVVLDFYISRIKINHFQIENIKGIANDIRKAIERTTGKRRKKFYQKLQLNLEEQKKNQNNSWRWVILIFQHFQQS